MAERAPAEPAAKETEHAPPAARSAGGRLEVGELPATIGNRAFRTLARKLGGKPQTGQLITRPSDGAIFEIISSSFDTKADSWSYKVKGTAPGSTETTIGASDAGYDFSSATQQIEAVAKDDKADFKGVVGRIPEARLNELAGFEAWLRKIRMSLSDERFAYLAANIMLVSRYAPKARTEALRSLTPMLGDKDTAMRMILKPVQAVIVPRNKQMTDLDEFKSLLTSDSGKGPGKTFDGREWAHVRGVGNVTVGAKVYAAITEENLLGGVPDASVFAERKDKSGNVTVAAGTVAGGYAVGYSTTTHEFAHVLHRNGLSADQKKLISKHYAAKRTASSGKDGLVKNIWPDGPRVAPAAPQSWKDAGWTDDQYLDHLVGLTDAARRKYENYSSQNDAEYFAQLANAYLGTNLGTDPTTRMPRNNGRAWIAANEDKEMLDLLDLLFKNKTVNDIEAGGALKAGGLCTNPNPAPAPAPAGPPPVKDGTGGK